MAYAYACYYRTLPLCAPSSAPFPLRTSQPDSCHTWVGPSGLTAQTARAKAAHFSCCNRTRTSAGKALSLGTGPRCQSVMRRRHLCFTIRRVAFHPLSRRRHSGLRHHPRPRPRCWLRHQRQTGLLSCSTSMISSRSGSR